MKLKTHEQIAGGLHGRDCVRIIMECTECLEVQHLAIGATRAEVLETLRKVFRAGVQSISERENTVTLETAAWESIRARDGRRKATLRDLRHFVRRMMRQRDIACKPLRSMQTRDCRALLQRCFGNSAHSYRKGRAILHSIFAFGMRREWCDKNPVDRIENPYVSETEICPLSPKECSRLTRAAACTEHRDMQLSLHLLMYCGIRPAEVQRIDPFRDIDWKAREVHIRPSTSKTGGGRVLPLRRAGDLLRSHCPMVIPKSWERRWKDLRRAAGFHQWKADVLRHTFATYHVQFFHDYAALQVEMGHRDLSMLRSRYVNSLPGARQDAREFWRSTTATA